MEKIIAPDGTPSCTELTGTRSKHPKHRAVREFVAYSAGLVADGEPSRGHAHQGDRLGGHSSESIVLGEEGSYGLSVALGFRYRHRLDTETVLGMWNCRRWEASRDHGAA